MCLHTQRTGVHHGVRTPSSSTSWSLPPHVLSCVGTATTVTMTRCDTRAALQTHNMTTRSAALQALIEKELSSACFSRRRRTHIHIHKRARKCPPPHTHSLAGCRRCTCLAPPTAMTGNRHARRSTRHPAHTLQRQRQGHQMCAPQHPSTDDASGTCTRARDVGPAACRRGCPAAMRTHTHTSASASDAAACSCVLLAGRQVRLRQQCCCLR
jgi:hypothetical protein